jgi:hypothetical protein
VVGSRSFPFSVFKDHKRPARPATASRLFLAAGITTRPLTSGRRRLLLTVSVNASAMATSCASALAGLSRVRSSIVMSAKKSAAKRAAIHKWTVISAATGTLFCMRLVRGPHKLKPAGVVSVHRRASERAKSCCPCEVTSMSFFIAAVLGAFSDVIYLAGERQAFTSVCRYTLDLCQHPSWPLYLAAVSVAFRDVIPDAGVVKA